MAIANNTHQKERTRLTSPKPIGQHFVEAGLLNEAQIHVALTDQQVTGMRFGEVIVARGWMKEQTVEYLMKKVVVPERQRLEAKRAQIEQQTVSQQRTHVQPRSPATPSTPSRDPHATDPTHSDFKRREPPITKPLPSVNSVDSDVSWVG